MKTSIERKYICYLIFTVSIFLIIINFRNNVRLPLPYSVERDVKPNFVFILTDDQDSWLDSLTYMKNVNNLLMKDGLSFQNSFVASPLCCPSRSSILTGQYVHNHEAINNSIAGGCNSISWREGPEKRTFSKLLHEHGYNNFFAGKYLNQYGSNKGGGGLKHIPPGWDWWIGLEGNSRYYDYNLSVNGTKRKHAHDPNTDYLTNVIKHYALDYIEQLQKSSKQPFFMMISTPACHAPFTAEPKYMQNFQNKNIPRTPNFNIVNDESKHWLLRLGKQPLSDDIVNKIDEIYRDRLRTLLTVDDIVAEVYNALKRKNLLDTTYIIFSSDNGYHLGQFSLPLDKREPYEFDVRVPLVITGPNVRQGVSQLPIINVDIAPTILDLAGIDIPKYIDGKSLKADVLELNALRSSYQRTVLIEHSGESKDSNPGCYTEPGLYGCSPELQCKCSDSSNNTFSCLRHLSDDENYLYCAWKDNENFEEFYNLNVDNNQLHNIIKSLPLNKLENIRSGLRKYRKCKGVECRQF